MPFKANQDRRHRIPKQRHRVTNWPAYEAGLRARGSLTLWFTPEAVAAWRAEPRTGRGGQPRYSGLAIATALTLRAVYCARFSRPPPRPSDKVYLRMNGVLHYLWRAVDQRGVVLDILVQGRRNATAAKRFFKRLLAGLKHKPRRIVTDGLRSYGAAKREVLPDVRHRTGRYLNNRAENLYGAFCVKRSLFSCPPAVAPR